MSGFKVITGPRIYVVGRQRVDADEMARFLGDIGADGWGTDARSDAEHLIEFAGRACYNSYARPRPGGNAAYLANLIESGHGSCLEHGVWTILIAGISRSLTHELIRHRVGLSPSQLSQRFVDESDCAFVAPPAIAVGMRGYQASQGESPRDGAELASWQAFHIWQDACIDSANRYGSLVARLEAQVGDIPDRTIRRKRAREAARSVLPNCVETRICLTGNARAWRWLCEQRGGIHADAEFRRLIFALLPILKAEAPNLFADLEVVGDGDAAEVRTPHRKV